MQGPTIGIVADIMIFWFRLLWIFITYVANTTALISVKMRQDYDTPLTLLKTIKMTAKPTWWILYSDISAFLKKKENQKRKSN